MQKKGILIAFSLAVVLALGFTLAATAEVAKPEACLDKNLCAEKLRFGHEAFSRAKYMEAKQYFKQAITADPSSARAWAFYDLSTFYALAEQVKRTGTVRTSPAPAPDTYTLPPAGGAQAPAATTTPKQEQAPVTLAPAVPAIPPDEGC